MDAQTKQEKESIVGPPSSVPEAQGEATQEAGKITMAPTSHPSSDIGTAGIQPSPDATISAQKSTTDSSVLLNPEEFAEDLENRLGRANGNVYHRKPGIEGVHDGQIMVRLKKKRFIVIDYGITPTAADIQAAASHSHFATPAGAGRQKCVTPECPKVGIPVLLYDSAPEEPASLYMRSGLCFTCQRTLNEKRRTQRKRKNEVGGPPGNTSLSGIHGSATLSPHITAVAPGMTVEPQCIDSDQKRFKLNGQIIDLGPDAIVINGPVDGTKHQERGYGFIEIGSDLQNIVREASHDTDRLVAAAANNTSKFSANPTHSDPSAFAAAAAAVASAAATAAVQNVAGVSEEAVSAANAVSVSGLLEAKADSDADAQPEQQVTSSGFVTSPTLSKGEIASLYEKTFLAMSKGIFLLTQWKASWDVAAVSANATNSTNSLPGADEKAVADAVASAAAVAAASNLSLPSAGTNAATASVGQDQSSSNMIPLLLAAEAKGEDNTQNQTVKPALPERETGAAPAAENSREDKGGNVQVCGV